MVTSVTSLGRNGLSDWVIQRATAVILLAYTVFMFGYLMTHSDVSYEQWRELFSCTSVKVFSILALLSVCAHALVGLWAVSTDYMTTRMMGSKGTAVRLVFQAFYAIVIFAYAVVGIQVLWSV